MSSTKPYLRMKAVLMMYKVFLRYPEALKPAFPKLKEKLEDPDPGFYKILLQLKQNMDFRFPFCICRCTISCR